MMSTTQQTSRTRDLSRKAVLHQRRAHALLMDVRSWIDGGLKLISEFLWSARLAGNATQSPAGRNPEHAASLCQIYSNTVPALALGKQA